MRHVIWDWNGTLFDDLHIVVESVNASIAPFGAEAIDAEIYRDHYTRPVQRFYDVLLGRPITSEEWRTIDVRFHREYRNRLSFAGLHATAVTALGAVVAGGKTQSILSMWWHEELVPMVAALGVDRYMTRVDGNRRDAGEPKAVQLDHHLDALAATGVARDTVVMIGDAKDDADACRANDIACVLFDSGSHHRHELESTGYPVADDLSVALDIAGFV